MCVPSTHAPALPSSHAGPGRNVYSLPNMLPLPPCSGWHRLALSRGAVSEEKKKKKQEDPIMRLHRSCPPSNMEMLGGHCQINSCRNPPRHGVQYSPHPPSHPPLTYTTSDPLINVQIMSEEPHLVLLRGQYQVGFSQPDHPFPQISRPIFTQQALPFI